MGLQFNLAKYIISIDKTRNKEIIEYFLSNMPKNLTMDLIEDMKKWGNISKQIDLYEKNYVDPLSNTFDAALNNLPNEDSNKGIMKNIDINEASNKIYEMFELSGNNKYSNQNINHDLLYKYYINSVGVVTIYVYYKGKEIFSLIYSCVDMLFHDIRFLESSSILTVKYDFDISLIYNENSFIIKENATYFLSNILVGYSIDLEHTQNGNYERKYLKILSKKQLNDIVMQKKEEDSLQRKLLK